MALMRYANKAAENGRLAAMPAREVVSITEARARLSALVREAAEGSPVYIGSHRKAEAVIVSAAEWDSLTQSDE